MFSIMKYLKRTSCGSRMAFLVICIFLNTLSMGQSTRSDEQISDLLSLLDKELTRKAFVYEVLCTNASLLGNDIDSSVANVVYTKKHDGSTKYALILTEDGGEFVTDGYTVVSKGSDTEYTFFDSLKTSRSTKQFMFPPYFSRNLSYAFDQYTCAIKCLKVDEELQFTSLCPGREGVEIFYELVYSLVDSCFTHYGWEIDYEGQAIQKSWDIITHKPLNATDADLYFTLQRIRAFENN